VKEKILCVVGARPNFMKIAPIIDVMRESRYVQPFLLHTGQHYDAAMKHAFFDQLGIPEPDVDLGVGSGSHAVQTAEIMRGFEPVLDQQKPAAVLVVGDVNSTIACALVAVKKDIPVIHVEAGLRSYDRKMPEEINRVLTDQISDLLFTTERNALANLTREGIDAHRVHFVGNVMIDTLRKHVQRATPPQQTLAQARDPKMFTPGGYGVVTLHRPSNVDDRTVLERLLTVLQQISVRLPLVFPIHPRTRARIKDMGLSPLLETTAIHQTAPLGYLEMLGLMAGAKVAITDSGGIQEETTALGIPCLTLRENTERPITVEEGTNLVVGTDPQRIMPAFEEIMRSGGKAGRTPENWDGQAAQRIVAVIEQWIAQAHEHVD
jgi:UDP-N-acetylglucosamine 2-epimerase (non-hydrolysing)